MKQVDPDINTNEALNFFNALKMANSNAIRELAQKISYSTKQAAYKSGLTKQDAEELLNDALVITIKNIRDGKFQFVGISPAGYANGIVKKLIANRLRKKKLLTSTLYEVESVVDFSPDEYLKKKEREQMVGALLSKLGEVCQKILKLKYFESYKDEEVISLQLTHFSSINSLKSKRSQCLKKLINLAGSKTLN